MMRRATVDAVRSHLDLLHRRRHTSISLYAVASSGPPADRRLRTFSCTHSRSHASEMATDNLRQLEALMKRPDQDRAALRQPVDLSPRTPNTISADFNAADEIERHLRADGHRIWGFAVYRCTYTSDAAWESCIQVDEASTRSVISEESERWVKLIRGDWESRGATRQRQQQHETRTERMVESQGDHNDDESEFGDVEDDEECPAIEGLYQTARRGDGVGEPADGSGLDATGSPDAVVYAVDRFNYIAMPQLLRRLSTKHL
ncbi:hypothetical protein F5X99DRAFT_426448 [Biscogniauxia marginata]|nr:hypothetical protein F5X99DRAFT_426448 [Biscogniauxia marginata]